MTKDKQIAEMAVMGCRRNPQAHEAEECLGCEFKKGMCDIYKLAKILHEKGYRKASDVAREIFEEIEKLLKQTCEKGYVGSISDLFAELKKKYESEKDNGEV